MNLKIKTMNVTNTLMAALTLVGGTNAYLFKAYTGGVEKELAFIRTQLSQVSSLSIEVATLKYRVGDLIAQGETHGKSVRHLRSDEESPN